MKNKILSIGTLAVLTATFLPGADATNCKNDALSKSTMTKTAGTVATGVANAEPMAYGMIKGLNYYLEAATNKVCKRISEKLKAKNGECIKVTFDNFYDDILTEYKEVCDELKWNHFFFIC